MVPVSVSPLPFLFTPSRRRFARNEINTPAVVAIPSFHDGKSKNQPPVSSGVSYNDKKPFPAHEDHNFSSQLDWDTFDDRQLIDAHMIDASQTPPASCNAPPARTMPRVSCRSPAAHTQTQPKPDKLRFLQLDEWNEHNSYEEEVPTCIHYSIEWKVAVNSKELSKDTERDLVLAPTAYWHMVLKPKLERLLRKMLLQNRHVRSDDTNVIVSVNHRSERDLIKRFEDIDVDWSIIEKQTYCVE
jgi:hypothetical protein